MRTNYIAISLIILAIMLFYGIADTAQNITSVQYNSNFTAAQNYTRSYINKVNQSAYLVFYPNLTAAYDYLSMARNESSTNEAYSYSLLAKARSSAQMQQIDISKYATASLYTLIILSVVLTWVLYMLMKPHK